MKEGNSFLILAPNDKYCISILSELISQLLAQYPDHKIIISPVRGIRFDYSRKRNPAITFAKLIKYYASEFILEKNIRSLFYSFNNSINNRNVEVLSFPSWILLRRNKLFNINKMCILIKFQCIIIQFKV